MGWVSADGTVGNCATGHGDVPWGERQGVQRSVCDGVSAITMQVQDLAWIRGRVGRLCL